MHKIHATSLLGIPPELYFLLEVCGTVAIEHKYYAPEWAKKFPKAEADVKQLYLKNMG